MNLFDSLGLNGLANAVLDKLSGYTLASALGYYIEFVEIGDVVFFGPVVLLERDNAGDFIAA